MTAAAAFMQPNATADAAALAWLKDAALLEKTKAPDWMRALRATGAEVFGANGLPTPAWEGWQYTNLRGLLPEKFCFSADPAIIDAADLPPPLLENASRIVLVNGQYRPHLSRLPEGVVVAALTEADGAEEYLATVGDLAAFPFVALNAAYLRDGFVLTVPKGKDIAQPIEVLFYTTSGAASYPRVLYRLEENSGAVVVERHAGAGAHLANIYTGIVQEPSSRLKYYRFLDENAAGNHFSHTLVRQEKNAVFEGFSLAMGQRLARQETRSQLTDSGISSTVGGIYLLKDQQHHDFTILADHFEPGGKSAQHFKGVVDAQARAVFQGKIHVRRPAQKTDGCQSHHALLLSDRAEASAKPELEIYADDVKCSHGATTGRLDEAALFYMQSRGISAAEAKSLLIHAFLEETVDRITHDPVRDVFRDHIAVWLKGRAV